MSCAKCSDDGQPDLRKGLISIQDIIRNFAYPKMIATRDIAGLEGLFGRREDRNHPHKRYRDPELQAPQRRRVDLGLTQNLDADSHFHVLGWLH